MTQGGQCWELPMLGRRTSGIGFGSVPNNETFFHTPNTHGMDGGSNSRRALAARMWQTPVADDSVNRAKGKINSRGEPKLSAQVKQWPTPTVCGNHNRKGASATSGDGLATAVRTWPTPIARDCRTVKGGARSPNSLGTEPLITQVAIAEAKTDGALNPQWVEWLMGWPIGHTDLRPSATAKCPNVQPQHGECLEAPEC
jgi:hypothetical protein